MGLSVQRMPSIILMLFLRAQIRIPFVLLRFNCRPEKEPNVTIVSLDLDISDFELQKSVLSSADCE